jgi:hypothetical protein
LWQEQKKNAELEKEIETLRENCGKKEKEI